MTSFRIAAVFILLCNVVVAGLFALMEDPSVRERLRLLAVQGALALALATDLWFRQRPAPPLLPLRNLADLAESSIFRFMASLLFLLSLASLALGLRGVIGPSPGKPLHILLPASAIAANLGIGLWLHCKWSSALYVAVSFVAACRLVTASIASGPSLWGVLSFSMAAPILFPAVRMIRDWRRLEND